MVDVFSRKQRSFVMRSVKGSGNKSTEMELIRLFRAFKLTGWRRNYGLPGKPDFVFPARKIAVFADGCFWHGHDCRNVTPSQNADYWLQKIARNMRRDASITMELKKRGWKVYRIWECRIGAGRLPGTFLKQFSSPS